MKILYLSRTNTNRDRQRSGINLKVGPAYQKLFHVSQAIRTARVSLLNITVPVCSEPLSSGSIPPSAYFEGRAPFVSLGQRFSGALGRLYALIAFLICIWRLRNQFSHLIFYNFFPEYIPAAILATLLGRRPFLDVEDGPRHDEPGVRGFVTRASYFCMSAICRPQKITVSKKLADLLGIAEYLPVYGASPDLDAGPLGSKFEAAPISILFGGALLPETGIRQYAESLKIFTQLDGAALKQYRFIVTGFGEFDYLKVALNEVREKVRIDFFEDVPFHEYEKILASCDVALCLKLPGTSMGDTTFPSKVVEITRSGALLVTTPVSDVPAIFDTTNAIILTTPFENSLANALKGLADDRESAKRIAARGRQRCSEIFSYHSVGSEIAAFLSKHASTR